MKAWEAVRSQGRFCRIDERIIFLDRDFYQTECGAIVRPEDEFCPCCSRGFGPDFARNVADNLTGKQWHEVHGRLNDAREFVCSACMYGLMFQAGEEAWTTGPFTYCPGCGRRIENYYPTNTAPRKRGKDRK